MSEWLKENVNFANALKVGLVVFLYALAILFIISVILAMFGVY